MILPGSPAPTSSVVTGSTSSTVGSGSLFSNRISPQNLAHLLEFISIIVRSSINLGNVEEGTKPPTLLQGNPLTLLKEDQDLLLGKVQLAGKVY
jgi:hypothetical protein